MGTPRDVFPGESTANHIDEYEPTVSILGFVPQVRRIEVVNYGQVVRYPVPPLPLLPRECLTSGDGQTGLLQSSAWADTALEWA